MGLYWTKYKQNCQKIIGLNTMSSVPPGMPVGCKVLLLLGLFDIYKLTFEEDLRKKLIQIMKIHQNWKNIENCGIYSVSPTFNFVIFKYVV